MMKDAKGIDKQWVILNELASKVSKIKPLPEDVYSKLRIANNIITYYLLDEHADFEVLRDAEKEISKIQVILFGLADPDTSREYLIKMGQALRNEIDLEFPLKQTTFNTEVKRKKSSETVRITMPVEVHIEVLGELSERNGVIFELSHEDDQKVLIEGVKERITAALKDFSVIWKFNDN
uniref:DUF2096 domain-containing protein n=1 Tax=Methanococcus maripaludis (strain C6 / ATCC BAA-1332) TaxID=444158 RepID=A9A993_METM6